MERLRHVMRESPRARAYGVMALGALVGGAAGAMFDQLTWTVSPEYFAVGKGMASSALPPRWAAAWVGLGGGLAPGVLVAGVGVSRAERQPDFRWQPWFRSVLLAALAIFPAAAALMFALDPFGMEVAALELWDTDTARRYLMCWSLHAAAYLSIGGAVVRSANASRPDGTIPNAS